MRSKLGRLAVLILAVLLVGCGGPKFGYIVSKRIVPPMDWIWLEPVTVGKTIVLIPVQMHDDECQELTLKQDTTKKDSSTICVAPMVYQQVTIGDFYKEQE